MITFPINWDNIEHGTRETIRNELIAQALIDLEKECSEYKATRATYKTFNDKTYAKAAWQDIMQTEYGFENNDEVNEFCEEKADRQIKKWRGILIEI